MPDPEIIYEDKDFVAVNKPAGLLVHQANLKLKAENLELHEATLVDWLLKKYPEIKNVGDDPITRPGIVHRLDRETSGVMVIAKHQKYFEYLKSLFKRRQIKKKYIALVWGKVTPEEGVIEKPIGIKDGTVKRSVYSQKMAKEAITKYRVMRYFAGQGSGVRGQEKEIFSLVEVEPLTGRTHQIRVHMASIGHPVLGDKVYGSKTSKRVKCGFDRFTASRLMLHALSLEFVNEDGRRIKLEAELPEDYNNFLVSLSPAAQ